MDISKTLFATMVKNARMDRHWTQEELAEKLGVSPTYLGDLERHKGTPSLSLFCKAMRLLNLSADDYVYPNGNSDSSTYKQLLRLLTHCNEHQLQILLATATAMLQPNPCYWKEPFYLTIFSFLKPSFLSPDCYSISPSHLTTEYSPHILDSMPVLLP